MIINTERLRKKLEDELENCDEHDMNAVSLRTEIWRLERMEKLYEKYFGEVEE